jgi:hypothetical protein
VALGKATVLGMGNVHVQKESFLTLTFLSFISLGSLGVQILF